MKYLWLASSAINPLNAELNPICHLLALLGAHHILYVSRIRVKACPVATVLLLISLSSRSLSAITDTKTKKPWKTARNVLGNC